MLNADATLTPHHIGNGEAFDFSTVIAEVVRHPTDPRRLFGIAIIGFAIGLMIMLADALFRKAWIEVRYGPRWL